MQSVLLLHDDGIELLKGKLLVAVSLVQDMRIVHHFRYLLVSHRLAQLPADALYLFEVNGAYLVGIVEVEDLQKALLGAGVSQFAVDHLQELVEVYGLALALQVQDHLEDGLVALVEAQLLQDLLDLLGVDAAGPVLVEEVEGALELLQIVRRELFAGRYHQWLGFAGGLRAHSNLQLL